MIVPLLIAGAISIAMIILGQRQNVEFLVSLGYSCVSGIIIGIICNLSISEYFRKKDAKIQESNGSNGSNSLTMDTARLIEMLPAEDQRFAHEFVKKLVLAWDPDFTRVTPEEAAHIKAAEESGFIPESEIDWDKIGQ